MHGSKNVKDFQGVSSPKSFFSCTDNENGGSKLSPNFEKFPYNTSDLKNKITNVTGTYAFTRKLR